MIALVILKTFVISLAQVMLHIKLLLLSSSRLFAFIWVVGFASVAARLPEDELESLSVIARSLGKTDWILDGVNDIDPCSGQPPWRINKDNKIVCDSNCTLGSNTTLCHVTEIVIKEGNLSGSLPRELVGLPFLQVIDLTRNYLNGTIPPEWGSMQSLRIISLLGNLLTGPLPKELANITTLTELVLEANQINGTIPSEFGDLTRLARLLLTSNNFTGALPQSLAKLTSLSEFRISDNNFTGSIPDFIQNWINITRIEIQASGLTGPIPSNLTSLTNLVDLRISDLNGNRESGFPKLQNSIGWDKLILRSCNIVGELAGIFDTLKIDEILDLSFNKLTGQIPPNLGALKVKNIYLAGNFLNGTVPELMSSKSEIDLSYNNFTTSEASIPKCGDGGPNLFANSKGSTNTGSFYCVTQKCKPNDYYYFHINCGSSQKVGEYDADGLGDSRFYQSSHWGFSRTGDFQNPDDYGKSFTFSNSSDSPLSANNFPPQLYQDARLTPLSLTYFGFCLREGNYNVTLHFAEIMFGNVNLGRRIFDICIQGVRVEKDYNIADRAGGINKAHAEYFPANVTDNTLEIRFYWAGKGTTALPRRSVYGPLISAISVVHANYRPPAAASSLSAGAIAGIVMAVVFGTVILVVGLLWWKGKHSMHQDLKGLDLQTGSFTLRQIRAATNNFDPANKIGEGGFGPVFKGVLLDGTIIAVKQLSSKSKQGNREFVNEIGMISALQHPHLVKLYGCCIEGNQLLLVYEYMDNNSLARALFGPEGQRLDLDWAMRHMICIGIARGLTYLHEESRLKIVHRDIKATNVLLDGNLVPKISDFGLAKLDEEDDTHISTRIAGTFGYMAPEYAMRGYLTDKADVYSFGVVLLEIISGRSNSSIRPKAESFYLLDWANSLKVKGNLMELVDPRLETSLDKKEAIRAINIALLCTNTVATERPSMSAVVSMLEGKDYVDNLVVDEEEMAPPVDIDYGEGQSVSMDAPWTTSSASTSDLYPIALDTTYWDNRPL